MPAATAIKPISPANAANFAKAVNRFQWTKQSERAHRQGTFRVLAPWCNNHQAFSRFVSTATELINRSSAVDRVLSRTYAIEPDELRANQLRVSRTADRVTTAPIDRVHYRDRSVNAIWFEPPVNMPANQVADHLNTVATALHVSAGIFLVLTPEQLRACAGFLAPHCDIISVHSLTGRSAPLIVAGCSLINGQHPDYITDRQRNKLLISDDGQTDADQLDVPNLPTITSISSPYLRSPNDYNTGSPVLSMPYSPREIIQAADRHGSWNHPVVADIFNNDDSHQAIQPIERLPEGHSAIIAANSMIDHVLIKDPTNRHNPVIIRGFFKKANRETFRTPEVVKRTDFYDSNILAMDTVTGEISQVGETAEGLEEFMDAYGSAIRHNIDVMYPPTVDTRSTEYARVGALIDAIPRPLIGKQRHAAIAGAIHLKDNPHLNFFATQGSGKTCTTAGIATGLQASIIAVITPSRVVPNWVDEIRAVFPRAIIRVVRNDHPIGAPHTESPLEFQMAPAPFARASLEEIRAVFKHATPESPLWIILKKDNARTSYPFQNELRQVWSHDGQTPQPIPRPLAQLAQAEKAAGARPMPGSSPTAVSHPKRLIRSHNGVLAKLSPAAGEHIQNQLFDPNQPTLVCPSCWHPVHNHPVQSDRLRTDDRRQRCPSETQHPVFPKLTREWAEELARIQDDADQVLAEPPHRLCEFPLVQPTPDRHGRRIYSYGDYFTKHLVRQMDLLIIDESQDYKARDTLQGTVTRRMAQRARRTIALTGTPFGGRVSDFFYQLIAFNPKFTKDFSYHDYTRFIAEFGRQELTETLNPTPNGHASWKSSRRSIPGYHPKLLTYFWDNTIFMNLDDVDTKGILPSFTQHARLIEMDDQVQGQSGFSQQTAYDYLDDTLSAALSVSTRRVRTRRSRKTSTMINRSARITNYIQEMITYPENAWAGAAPKDPETGQPICTMPPLKADWLYPKENELISILERHRDLGRKCLVYCTHTKLRDVTTRLKSIIEKEGFRVLQLTSAVKQEQRAAWLRREAARNDVIICHPKLVETGVNLIEYPTIIWYEIDHSMITTEQASARSYRINQTLPVEVYYLAYAGTMQEHALHLIAQKSDVSRTFRGDLSKNGLSAFNPTEDDVREEIARALLKGEYLNSRHSLPAEVNVKALDRMFNETNIMAGEAYYQPDAQNSAQDQFTIDPPTAAAPDRRRRREPMPQTFIQPTLGI